MLLREFGGVGGKGKEGERDTKYFLELFIAVSLTPKKPARISELKALQSIQRCVMRNKGAKDERA